MGADVPAVSAAIRIIQALSRHPDGVAPGTLIADLNINRSTCYNIMGTMEQAGWVVRLRGRPGWTLGPGLLLITGVSNQVRDAISQDEIEQLSAQLGFVVFVASAEPGGGYRALAVADRGSGVRVTVSVGDTFPFSAPALMQAFLSWGGDDKAVEIMEERGLVQFTNRTVTDVRTQLGMLAKSRRHGYSQSLDQYQVGQGGVAAPIFDSTGSVHSAVCALAFSSQLNVNNVQNVGRAVSECAQSITARTGGVPPAGLRKDTRRSA